MYEAIDRFMLAPTWRQDHDADTRRFFEAIAPIIRKRDFDPEKLSNRMQQQANARHDDADIARYVSKAHAVREYLYAIGEL